MDCILVKLSSKLTSLFVYLVMATSAFGIILQDDLQPPDHPDNAVVGAWGVNASCVAIAPNYILTCRHQGGGIGTLIKMGG